MYKRKDGLWCEKVTIDGKQKYFYGKTKSDVISKMRDAQDRKKSGRMFASVADAWWEKHEPTISPNSVRNYSPALKRAKDYFAEIDVAEIRPVDVQRFLSKITDEHNMAEKTAKTQILVVNLVFRYAVVEGYIDSNPCADVRVEKGLKKERRDAASEDDIAKVKANADKPFGLFPLIMLTCGLRDGEVLALRWGDIDLENRDITVRASVFHVHKQPYLKEPKTKAGIRKVPILDSLLPYIQDKGSDDEFIFGGKEPLKQNRYEYMWRKYKSETGIECTPYQLRHAYATALWEAGVDESLASKLLGHAQISTTKDIYTHLRDSKAADERRRIIDLNVV